MSGVLSGSSETNPHSRVPSSTGRNPRRCGLAVWFDEKSRFDQLAYDREIVVMVPTDEPEALIASVREIERELLATWR